MALYRMLAIDLDGTLLSPDGTVSARNKAAIRKALDAGLLVCFATGRNWTESQTILDAVEHYSTAVFVSGALVVDTLNRQTLHRMGMDGELAREVCGLIESLGQAALVLQDRQGASGADYLATDGMTLNEATRQWMEVTSATIHRVRDLATRSHEHTIRIGIVAAREECARMQPILKAHFGERIQCHSLFVPAYDVEVLEVFDPAVNKWRGILEVAKIHRVEPSQIVAIGDDINDLPMLTQAGLGVAMGNAKEEVRQAAKLVIKSNQEDGLAEFIEELIATREIEPEHA
jgi:Cof subfamily protein (haloacid dehalogenase superfamily)